MVAHFGPIDLDLVVSVPVAGLPRPSLGRTIPSTETISLLTISMPPTAARMSFIAVITRSQ
jgi:hypothetical protein